MKKGVIPVTIVNIGDGFFFIFDKHRHGHYSAT